MGVDIGNEVDDLVADGQIEFLSPAFQPASDLVLDRQVAFQRLGLGDGGFGDIDAERLAERTYRIEVPQQAP